MGTPDKTEWPEGHQLAKQMNFKFPAFEATPLTKIVPNASKDAIYLMEVCSNPKHLKVASKFSNSNIFRTCFAGTHATVPQLINP